MEAEQIIIEPLVTEKSVGARAQSCYVFKVNKKATKVAVRQAIEKIFKVKVTGVNTCFVRAKEKTVGKHIGKVASWKKAYVTLAAGAKIAELEA
jgi:large subunit ribosomal protein L23